MEFINYELDFFDYFITTNGVILLVDKHTLYIGNLKVIMKKFLSEMDSYNNVKKLHFFISRDVKLYTVMLFIETILDLNITNYKIIIHYMPLNCFHEQKLKEYFKDSKIIFDFERKTPFKIDDRKLYIVNIGTKSGVSINVHENVILKGF